MHLGDYVYVSTRRTLTLDDYRGAYRRWRRSRCLRDLHAALPMVAMWDDGEFYNGVDSTGPPERLDERQAGLVRGLPARRPRRPARPPPVRVGRPRRLSR